MEEYEKLNKKFYKDCVKRFGKTVDVHGMTLHAYPSDASYNPNPFYEVDSEKGFVKAHISVRYDTEKGRPMGEFYLWSDFVPHETAWVSCKSLKDAAEILESWFNESPAEKYKEMVKSISNGGRRHDRLQVGNIIFEGFYDDKLVGYDTIFHGVYVRLLPAYYNDLNQHNWVLVIGDKHFVCETPGEHTSRFSMNDKGKTLRELLLANIPGAKEHEYEDWCLYSGKYGERGLQNSPGGWAAVGGNYSEGRHEIWWCPDEENPEMFQIELDWCVNGKRQVIVCLTGERSLEGAKTTALTMALLRISGKKPDYGEW